MNAASFLLLAVIGVLFVLAVRSVLKGRGNSCGGNCSGCSMRCGAAKKKRPRGRKGRD
ncbi:FeoB-associated Cys-rich membrane protein [Megasphaera sp. DISK 18]|uniref:FeoB-associated Cys-rich membrane protein n=1 Tax=Megasphaera sp. DISK 18 TaxID=1776081 RepID=UPI0011474ADF|nr:FeoB-associated Cys-rich membrane protein [Megasphaera sp. DISK 18]